MQTVRTTITLPQDVYEDLRKEAFETKKSLNKTILERIKSKKVAFRSNKEILDEMRRLTKNVDIKGIDYKSLINEGRRF